MAIVPSKKIVNRTWPTSSLDVAAAAVVDQTGFVFREFFPQRLSRFWRQIVGNGPEKKPSIVFHSIASKKNQLTQNEKITVSLASKSR